MNKSKSGYTRTTGIMQGRIKATEIENIQKTIYVNETYKLMTMT